EAGVWAADGFSVFVVTVVNFACLATVFATVADLDFGFAGRRGAGFSSRGVSTAAVLRRQPGETHLSVVTCDELYCACALMPASLMIGHHLSISAFWKPARPSGDCCSRGAP